MPLGDGQGIPFRRPRTSRRGGPSGGLVSTDFLPEFLPPLRPLIMGGRQDLPPSPRTRTHTHFGDRETRTKQEKRWKENSSETATHTHTHTIARQTGNNSVSECQNPRQLEIKQDRACPTPIGAFLQYRARGRGTSCSRTHTHTHTHTHTVGCRWGCKPSPCFWRKAAEQQTSEQQALQ